MRKAHILKDNKTVRIPNKFLFFDTETEQIEVEKGRYETRLKLVATIYYEKRHGKNREREERNFFYTANEFWNYVESKVYTKECLNIVAHNIDFDMSSVQGYEQLQARGWIIKSFIGTNQLYILRASKGNKKLVFFDTFNFYRTSVEELGKFLGLPKKEINFNTATLEELKEYCMRDVEIIYKIMMQFIEFIKSENIGSFKYTVSSQAFAAFRHKFMNHKIYIHNRSDALEIERKAYYGGRTECFFIGKKEGEKIYKLDVNSMYPFVMKKFEYPTKLVLTLRNPTIEMVQEALKKYAVVGEFIINTKEPVFPIKINNKIIFPVGKGIFYLTTEEVKYAVKKKYIEKCNVLYCYEKAKIFEDYVNYFYEKRDKAKRENNTVYANFYKMMLNTLYGKFGQKGCEWIKYNVKYPEGFYVTYEIDDNGNKLSMVRVLGNLVQKRVERGESYNSFPGIAAHVTANARMYLYSLMKKAGLKNVLYVDTDSLFTNEIGYKKLQKYIDNNELGKLKLEGVANYVEVRGLKDYTFQNTTKIKGVRNNAIKIDQNTYKQIRFLHFRSKIRENKVNTNIIEEYIKKLNRKYEKGIITQNGRVKPFEISLPL